MLDINDASNPYVEAFAAIEHQRWADWQAHFFSKCTTNPDGSLTVPAGYVAALYRLMTTPYAGLTAVEQAKDRREVARYWGVIRHMLADAVGFTEAN